MDTPIARWIPQSLAARVFMLYAVSLLVFLLGGLGMFYRYQFSQQIDDAQETAGMLAEIASETIRESAVIGDYDTVRRTLAKMVFRTPFRSAKFIDMSGGVIETNAEAAAQQVAPQWLRDAAATRLFDLNRVIGAGGRDYGVMRLSFDADLVAGQLWMLGVQGLALAASCLALGLLATRLLLRRWLGGLDRLHAYGARVVAGQFDAEAPLTADAPLEVRAAIEVVNRTSSSLREHFGQRIDGLMNALVQHKKAMDEAAIVCELDLAGQLTYVNDLFCRASGYPRGALLGTRLDALTLAEPGTQPWLPSAAIWHGEVRQSHPDGGARWRQRTIVPILDAAERVEKYICIDIDVTERRAAETTIHRLAYYDPLTDLPNRRMFLDRAQEQLRQSERTGRRFALLYVDLDQFKKVNDDVGHAYGDKLLVEAGRRIRGALREVDYVSRLGGDEFAALVVEVEDPAELTRIAQRIVEHLELPFVIGGHELFISASVGIVLSGDDAADVPTLLKRADSAMYCAKEHGRNTYAFFNEALEHKARYRLDIERDLRVALASDQLFLEYQPKVEAASGRLVGAEALLRWQHPQLGRLAPDRFISICEESRLIIPVGRWVIDEACRQLAVWQRAGLGGLSVAVNLSVAQFKVPDLAGEIRAAAARHGVDPAMLETEITESLLMDDPEQVGAVLNELHALGVRVAIDDFGTGYSSLSTLKRFPVSVLKIDRSFVSDLSEDAEDQAIALAIISLAKSLELQVVAEGVETAGQRAILARLGCDFLQGYLVSRPLAPAAFEAFARATPHAACPSGRCATPRPATTPPENCPA